MKRLQRAYGAVCDWWSLYGQFSFPVRAVAPHRRQAYAAVTSIYRPVESRAHEARIMRLALRIKDAEESRGAPDDSPLLREILGPDDELIMRRGK
ncbi:hypothetical protein AB0I22_06185 [Streptomyces sp. NPDC050610]|uniref:hypothetical protein n=1 Tax=Streptomyces sp. NPDC050610 TaxID=3157097 RepID=UPI003421EB9A